MSNKHQVKRSKRSSWKRIRLSDRKSKQEISLADLLAAKRAAERLHRK